MKNIIRIVALVIVVAIFSCKSAKKIQTAINKKDTTSQIVVTSNTHADSIVFIKEVLQKINSNRIINYKTFSAKIKVNYKDKEGEQPELTVFIRVQKDSLIWVSINATIFSYEALRVIISKDSIKVLNKKDKVVQLRSISYLQELTELPFDFFTLQDFLLGNPIYLDNNVVSYKKTEQTTALMNIGPLFKNLIAIDNSDFLVQHSKLDDVDPVRNRTCDLIYTGYENNNGVKFSTERRVTVSEKAKLDIDMNFKQFSFNEILSYPFSIPKNYKHK